MVRNDSVPPSIVLPGFQREGIFFLKKRINCPFFCMRMLLVFCEASQMGKFNISTMANQPLVFFQDRMFAFCSIEPAPYHSPLHSPSAHCVHNMVPLGCVWWHPGGVATQKILLFVN